MKIAAAQINLKYGDIIQNLSEHYRLIKLAAQNGVKLIAFPEMSITGYVLDLAEKLSFTENDSRLDQLRKLAVENDMIIIAGAPIKINSTLHIGSFVIFPDNSISIYTKQFLHTGEDKFFTGSFDYNPIINIGNERISLAICADINNPIHAENASKANSTIYLASICFSKQSITKAHDLLSNYAEIYSMDVLMSNYCGEYWGHETGGGSGFWSINGKIITGLDASSTGLLIGEKNNGMWKVMTVGA